jgi:hypothetical protein
VSTGDGWLSEQGDQFVHGQVGLAKNTAQRPTLNVAGMKGDHYPQSRAVLMFQDAVAAGCVVT